MKPVAALIAALLLTGSLGSVHAFSVLVAPLETRFGASRADVSLTYSMALISLTVAVLIGHRIYHRMTPALIGAGACVMAAAGLAVAALAPTMTLVYAGYGIMFGLANGVGYGFALIAAARAFPARQGMAMGVVTACYAVGAIVFAQVLQLVLEPYGLATALLVQAIVIAGCGLVAALLFQVSRLKMGHVSGTAGRLVSGDAKAIGLLWLGFGFGCAAGLMAISHAAGVVTAADGTAHQAVAGVMFIGLGNAFGGFLVAWLADRLPVRRLLVGLPILSAVGLTALALSHTPVSAVLLLAVIGLAYGAIIAIYPVATAFRFGIDRTPKIYGLVFTAWGVAGFAGPWLAGVLFDGSGGYRVALLLAAGGAVLSAAAAWRVADTGKSHAF
jgi:MFS transporter, OFA family, oxalate/formate antiporter